MALGPETMKNMDKSDQDKADEYELKIDAAIRTWDPDVSEHGFEIMGGSKIYKELVKRYEQAGWLMRLENTPAGDTKLLMFKSPKP
jgi:hypothetical protein